MTGVFFGYACTPLTAKFFDDNPDRENAIKESQPNGGLISPKQISDGILKFLDSNCIITDQIEEFNLSK